MDVPNSRWQEISVLKMFKVTSNLSHALKQPSAGEKKKKRRKKNYKHWKSILINWLKSLAGNEHRRTASLCDGSTYGPRHPRAVALLRTFFQLWCGRERAVLIGGLMGLRKIWFEFRTAKTTWSRASKSQAGKELKVGVQAPFRCLSPCSNVPCW